MTQFVLTVKSPNQSNLNLEKKQPIKVTVTLRRNQPFKVTLALTETKEELIRNLYKNKNGSKNVRSNYSDHVQ